ncbi:hypothetical protein C8R47DRAFT_1125157 [Mycena vitilis]|nr:hypothetical protein C8R47DRAFT_1125157 [Mycena vitilis]
MDLRNYSLFFSTQCFSIDDVNPTRCERPRRFCSRFLSFLPLASFFFVCLLNRISGTFGRFLSRSPRTQAIYCYPLASPESGTLVPTAPNKSALTVSHLDYLPDLASTHRASNQVVPISRKEAAKGRDQRLLPTPLPANTRPLRTTGLFRPRESAPTKQTKGHRTKT